MVAASRPLVRRPSTLDGFVFKPPHTHIDGEDSCVRPPPHPPYAHTRVHTHTHTHTHAVTPAEDKTEMETGKNRVEFK